MIQLQRLLFFISLLFTISVVNAQQETDTIKRIEVYGIRVGVDISKPIITLIDDNYKGIEFIADGRFYKNFYAALELGYDDKTSIEDYMNFTTKGAYVKIGANYNAYENWIGMTNEIYVGARYGLSFFNQTLNSYTPNIYGTYFISETVETNTLYPDLSAQWIELLIGIKAETLKNLYLGFSFSFNIMTTTKEPYNFKNLFVPGFNHVSLNNLGFGFNYTISYLIPYAQK